METQKRRSNVSVTEHLYSGSCGSHLEVLLTPPGRFTHTHGAPLYPSIAGCNAVCENHTKGLATCGIVFNPQKVLSLAVWRIAHFRIIIQRTLLREHVVPDHFLTKAGKIAVEACNGSLCGFRVQFTEH